MIKKKFLGATAAAVMTLSLGFGNFTFAENVNVSTEPPVVQDQGGVSTFGLEAPFTSQVWNLVDKKQMDFAGAADGSPLYTNNNFKGKSQVSVNIKNFLDKKLTVVLYKQGSFGSVTTITVNPNAELLTSINNLDANGLYYLRFSAPSDFKGYVK